MNLQVLFEDTELIVCYKPAGVPTQTSKIGSADMVSLLKNYLYKNQKEKREPYVAVVHRLDQPVEGILVFAKTPFAAKVLNRQVQDGGFGKYYKAVLGNVPKEKKARVEDYLLKDGRTNTSKVCDASVQNAKKAVLYYEVIKVSAEEGDIRCLVKIQLETGRHHQIRVQMAHMGCPIWGDAKYDRIHKEDGKWRKIALCAYHLEFRHPKTGELMEFEIEPRGEGFNLRDGMKIQLPENVTTIINTLKEHGYEAYAVGGCVRDSILGRVPDDWDITTSAKPEETKALFRRTFDTGIEHGTITVLMDKEAFEVTTYRVDGEYEDSRHPREVQFTRSLKEDLLRRDFTINAMAYNDEEGLVDIFGGIEDLNRKVIRCVGKAKERFGEDALRILRAVRFAAQLGFEIEEDTQQGIRELAPTLANISAERIQVELVKMLVSPNPGLLYKAYECGITKIILPEFDEMMQTAQETPHHKFSVGEHTLRAIEGVRADRVLRLTMLLHDVAKPKRKTFDENGVAHFKMHDIEGAQMAKKILKRLKFDNDTIGKVTRLVQYHDYRMPAQPKNVRRAMNKIGEDMFPYYLEVRRADTLAQSEYMREEKLQNIADIERCYQEILQKEECVSLKTLAVTGSDLLANGMEPGKEIGVMLNQLLELVIENPEYNTKEKLLSELQKRQ